MSKQTNNEKEKRFFKNLFSFINENFKKTDRYVLAVSGGADSMVLLDLFLTLKQSYPVTFCVVNVDHRIRTESNEEQRWLKRFCEKNQIQFYAETVDIKIMKKSTGAKTSLEQLARDERYKILKKVKKDFQARWIVTAHHKDDLLETFFLRLLRGTGLNGINTLNKLEGFYLRPLLDYTKEDILEYATEKGLFFFEDHTNDDIRFLRNKIRHHFIPYLVNEFGNEVKEVLIRDIENLKNADQVLSEMIKGDLQKAAFALDSVEINQQLFIHKSHAYLREFLIRMYQKWHGSPVGLTASKLEDICSKLSKKGDFEITITSSIRFLRSNDIIGFDKKKERLQKSQKEWIVLGEDFKKNLEKKNVITVGFNFSGQEETLSFQLLSVVNENDYGKTTGNDCAYLDYDKIQFPLRIRLWKEGDRIKPLGMSNFKRVSRFMTDEGKKKYAKRKQLMLENGKHDIIWCMGLRISEDYKITPSTVRCLQIFYNNSNNKDIEGRERYIPQRIDRDEEK